MILNAFKIIEAQIKNKCMFLYGLEISDNQLFNHLYLCKFESLGGIEI